MYDYQYMNFEQYSNEFGNYILLLLSFFDNYGSIQLLFDDEGNMLCNYTYEFEKLNCKNIVPIKK